jgi:hypothetical protein
LLFSFSYRTLSFEIISIYFRNNIMAAGDWRENLRYSDS